MPQTRSVEQDIDRYVQRENVYALWARARWSHWNSTEYKAVHRGPMSLHICSRICLIERFLISKHHLPQRELAPRIKYDENDR